MSRTGRPREFDRDEALHRAMELFWAQGYEGTTLTGLLKAMGGITAPSFYAAFGSKEDLFREAVELYKKEHGAPIMKAFAEGPTAREAMEGMLRAAAEGVCSHGHPRGCMMVLAGMNCIPANKGLEEYVRSQRCVREKVIRQRLRQGIADGDLPPETNISGLVAFYTSIIDGMAIRARDGASRKDLREVARYAMAAWDTAVQARGK